jgi:hypothetical protein
MAGLSAVRRESLRAAEALAKEVGRRWIPGEDLNLDSQVQSLLSYR